MKKSSNITTCTILFGFISSLILLIFWLNNSSKNNINSNELILSNSESEPKYLIKDYHATFGYNNIRFLIESTLILSKLLNRIPILPNSIWCRNCTLDHEICMKTSLKYFEKRNDHWDDMGGMKWNQDGEAWKIGIEHFIDLPHLKATYGPVLTISEFHQLYRLPLDSIPPSGYYKPLIQLPRSLSLSIMTKKEFESSPYIRIDKMNSDWIDEKTGEIKIDKGRGRLNRISITNLLKSTKKDIWRIEEIRKILLESTQNQFGLKESEDEIKLELEEIGIVGLSTFSHEVIMSKALLLPTTSYTFLTSLLPLSPLPPSISNKSILYLQGDLHDLRPPLSLYFSTPSARSTAISTIFQSLQVPIGIKQISELALNRIKERVGNRQWGGGHLRRGDFLDLDGDWIGVGNGGGEDKDKGSVEHFERMRIKLGIYREEVKRRGKGDEERMPRDDDFFYLATDESSPIALEYYKSHQALLLSSLLSPTELIDLIGPTGSYTDILSLVEQEILSSSDWFIGSGFSSTTGGILNLREMRGKERWSWGVL